MSGVPSTLSAVVHSFIIPISLLLLLPCALPICARNLYSDESATPFTFDDITSFNFSSQTYTGSWVNDSLLNKDYEGNLLLYDPQTEDTEILLGGNISMEHGFLTHQLSADGRFILLGKDYKSQWRHSYSAKYMVFDRENQTAPLIEVPNTGSETLQLVEWSPKGHQLVYVLRNNIYYLASPTSTPTQVTSTGEELVYNGVPDWLYEEDVLSSRKAIYWSPNSDNFLYGTFDDRHIPQIEFPMYGNSADVYGTTKKIPYPKAGDIGEDGRLGNNSLVSLYIYSVSEGSSKQLQPPADLADQDHYYLGVNWANGNNVIVTWSNRVMNHTIFTLCNVHTLSCSMVRDELYPGGWVRVPVLPFWFIDDEGTSYVTELSKDDGSSGKWQQVALVSATGGTDPLFLTSSEVEVLGVLGVDKVLRIVYFASTNGDPKQRHIFRVGLPDAAAEYLLPVCLTCGDVTCTYNGASFSDSATHYIRRCRGPDVPKDILIRLSDDKVTYLENNTHLAEAVRSRMIPTRELHLIDVGGGYKAHAEIFLPPGFSADKKYPLLISTYGGPGSQEVLDTFPLSGSISRWLAYLGSSHQVVVASVDGRGAGGRGDKYLYELYRRMGTVEVEDQAAAARFFQALPFIDSSKPAAIYGWSYGGEVSSQALAGYPVFGCAIAVAPVTSKRYYDTAYTERVMGFDLPNDNQAGYNDTDITAKAANFTGKKYMLAHGTADDNVHFMNTAQLVKALVEAEIQFKFEMYVDENHGIRSKAPVFHHLLKSMTNFLLEDCWDISQEPINQSAANQSASNKVLLSIGFILALMRAAEIG